MSISQLPYIDRRHGDRVMMNQPFEITPGDLPGVYVTDTGQWGDPASESPIEHEPREDDVVLPPIEWSALTAVHQVDLPETITFAAGQTLRVTYFVNNPENF